MKKPRIMHVVAGAEHGGAETFCLDAIQALEDAGVIQHVICRPHDRYLDVFKKRGIPYDTLSFSRMEKLRRAPRLIRERTQSFQPDIIHAWMGRAASFIPRHGIHAPVLGWFGGYYDLKRYRNCGFYMGVTRDIVRHIAEQSGRPDRAFLVHTFGTLEPMPPVDRQKLLTPHNATAVLLLSRMHWKKGVDVLLRAAAELPDVYFWLAGSGPDLSKYKKLAAELELEDRVRFLGWRDDRAALLGAADICVLPSRYEPFGTVIAEAWFAGVPLVAAKAAGASQYVTHGKDGLLCEIEDYQGLAAQIRALQQDPQLREKLVANGRATYNALFSRETTIRDLLAAYENIVGAGRRDHSAAR